MDCISNLSFYKGAIMTGILICAVIFVNYINPIWSTELLEINIQHDNMNHTQFCKPNQTNQGYTLPNFSKKKTEFQKK